MVGETHRLNSSANLPFGCLEIGIRVSEARQNNCSDGNIVAKTAPVEVINTFDRIVAIAGQTQRYVDIGTFHQ